MVEGTNALVDYEPDSTVVPTNPVADGRIGDVSRRALGSTSPTRKLLDETLADQRASNPDSATRSGKPQITESQTPVLGVDAVERARDSAGFVC
jgi:hypothetical protein